MNCKDALGILEKHRYRDCPKWLAYVDDHLGQYVIGFEASGKSTGSFSVFEATAIAKELQATQTSNGSDHKFVRSDEDLPQLEWRKAIDGRVRSMLKRLAELENVQAIHGSKIDESEGLADRLDDLESTEDRTRAELADQAYRIKAWGACVSDALKKIVAQDERIAKLEAKLDEFEATETVDEVVERAEAIESRLDRLESASFAHSCLESKVRVMDDATTEAFANTIDTETFLTLEKKVDLLAKRFNHCYVA
jgi:DNA repair ATPase RecN